MKKASFYIIVFVVFLAHHFLKPSEANTVSESEAVSESTRSAPNAIQTGDLVIFSVSEKGRHAGIYLNDGIFLHASTKDGVTLNRMSDTYWKDRLIAVRRVDHDISLKEFMKSYKQYDHARYAYGRTGPDRFDCSGLVWRVFNNHGVDVPRASREQLHAGSLVVTGEAYLATNQ